MRYSAEEVKGVWDLSPRVARRQADQAIPQIKEEISNLKGELQVFEDILEREIPEKRKVGQRGNGKTQEYSRNDEDSVAGGAAGSQQKEPEEAKA